MSAANPEPFDDLPDEPQVAWAKSVLPHAEAAAAALGVPVEGVLAQAALESGWGRSAPGGNLFGIKSHGQPGGTVQATTEYVGGQPVQENASFRSYADPAASVADYAEFLRTNPRYAGVLGAPDVATFARGLQSAGYATDPQYAGKLIATAQSPHIRAALAGRGASNRDPFADLPDDPAQAVTTPPASGAPPLAEATSAPAPAGPPEPDPFADLPDDPNFTGAQGNGLSRAVGTGQAVWPEEPNPAVAGGFVPPAPGTPGFDAASVRAEAKPVGDGGVTRLAQVFGAGYTQSLSPLEQIGLAADVAAGGRQVELLARDPASQLLPGASTGERVAFLLGSLAKQGLDPLNAVLALTGGAVGPGARVLQGAVAGGAQGAGAEAVSQLLPAETVQALRAAGLGHLVGAGAGEGLDPAALLRAAGTNAALGAGLDAVAGGLPQALRQARGTADALDAARAARQGLPPEPSAPAPAPAPAADPRLVDVTPEGVVVPQRGVVDDLPGLDGQPAGRVPPAAPAAAPASAPAPAARPSTVVDTAGTDVAASAAARAAEFARLAELAENPEVAAALRRLGEGAPPPSSAARETVVTPTGRAVETQFEVIDAGNLITSDRPEFPAELQPRERGARLASDAQEGVLAVVTDDAGQVLRVARLGRGSATEAPVDPGAVAGAITSTPGGTRAWLAHNHPSGIVRQSAADAELADHLGDLLDGSGVRFEGSVVVGPGGREFTLVPPREAELQGATTAAPRRGTLPVTERRLAGRDTGHAPIASSADAAAALERVAGDAPGVLMLDAQRRPVGWVEMTGGELRELRAGAGGGSARLLSAMDRTNAVAMVVRTDSEAAVGNLNAFGTATGRQLVDAIDRHGVSRLERGDLPTQSTFYANPFEPAVRAAGDYVRRNAGTQAAAALAGGVAAGTLSDEKIGSARWWLQVAAGAATAMFGSAVLRGLKLVGPDSFAARGLDRAGEWFSGLPLLGTGPAELRALKKQQQLMRQVIDRQTAEVGKILRSQFTAEERAMMADLIESRGIVREAGRVHRQAAELDAYLIHVGERMKALGMLPADLELGGYLHRYYRKDLGLDAGFREAKGQSLSGSYSLARGTVDEVDPAFLSPGARERLARMGELQREIAAAERKATREGVAGDVTLDGLRAELKTLRSQPLHEYIGEQNGALQSFWFAADEVPRVPETAALRPEGNRTRAPALPGHGLPPEQGARLTATERLWYPRGEAKGKALLWRDWTKAERTRWGEIEDAGYRYVRGLAEASHDLSLATLFKAVADNPSWASHEARAGWQPVPTASVGSGSRLRRYGALSGMWVEPNAWAHLRSYARPVFGDSLVARGYRAALGHWKAWKTVLNPVSHFNNLFSNTQMLYFAGYGPTDLARGARLMLRGEKDVLWREARDAGLFGDDFVAAELGRKTGGTRALGELADELLKQTDDADVVGTVSATSKALAKTVSVLTAPVRGYARGMEWLYRAEDDLFKLAAYAAERRKGAGAAEAVATAQRSFFDYGDLPRAVQWIRSFPVGAPFISYTWKALPAVVRHAVERPERVLALAAALEGVHFAAMAEGGLIDRGREYWQMIEDEDRALPDYEQGRVLWGGRKTVRLPGLDGYRIALGNAHVLGNPFATESSGEKAAAVSWVPQTWGPDVFGGNPLARLLVDLATNEDWKGKPLWHEGAPTAERWKRGLAYVYQNLAPSTPLMPGGYHQMRILESAAADAKRGEAGLLPAVVAAANDSLRALGMDQFTGENRYGELAAPTRDALLAAVGVKLRPLNLDQTERSANFEFDRQKEKSQRYIHTEGQKLGREIIDDVTFEARTAPAEQEIQRAQMEASARVEAIDRLRAREEKKPPR